MRARERRVEWPEPNTGLANPVRVRVGGREGKRRESSISRIAA